MKITILTVSCLREKNSDIYANLFIILKYPISPRKLYDFKSKLTKKKQNQEIQTTVEESECFLETRENT